MITLVNNPLSFLQFAKGNTPPACGIPLLFNDNGDLKFSVVLQGPEIEAAIAVPLKLYLLPLDFIPTTLLSIQGAAIAIHESGFAAEQLSSAKAVFYQLNKLYDDTDDFELPAEGECFRIAIALDSTIDGEKPYWLSNCILRSPANDPYSTIIEYSCNENSYGFYYCNADISNIVRVAMYLYQPQFEDDEDIYFLSDGTADILFSVTREDYPGITDYLDKETHLRLKTALSHDNVYVKSTEYTGGVRKNGAYAIDWPKDPKEKFAQANFKVFATPFLVRNDNCEDCNEPFGACPALTGVVVTPVDNGDGTQTITITWDNNDSLDIATSVTIKYKYTGSPDAYTEVNGDKLSPRSITVPLGKYDIVLETVGDGSETSCETFDSEVIPNVGIVPPECIAPTLAVPDFALPDGTTTIAYGATMNLNGTGPFTLSSVVKPAWMTITVTGNQIIFGGTPGSGDTGTDIAVSFTIENCDGDNTLDFADTIDVIAYVGLVHISSSMVGCMIANVTIPGFTFGAPIAPGGSQSGAHSAFTGTIPIQITGTPGINPSNISLHRGATLIACIEVTAAGTFVIPSAAYLTTDDIFISGNLGGCP